MKHRAADHNDRVACDDEDRKPCGKFSIMLIARTPVADAESNDAAEQQSFVGDRIENHAEGAALIVTTRDVAIETVTDGREKKDRNGGEPLPILRAAFLNALSVINRQGDEYRDHQDPDDGNFVGGCHLKARDHGTLQDYCETWQGKLRLTSAVRLRGSICPVCGASQSSSIILAAQHHDWRGSLRSIHGGLFVCTRASSFFGLPNGSLGILAEQEHGGCCASNGECSADQHDPPKSLNKRAVD